MTAFALNKPVIASNVGGMSESVHDGVKMDYWLHQRMQMHYQMRLFQY